MNFNAEQLDKFIRKIDIKTEEVYKLTKVFDSYCKANELDEGIYEISPIIDRLCFLSDYVNGTMCYYKDGEIEED